MAVLGTFTKQPGETLDFDISYATVLAGRSDTIVTKAVTVSPGAGMTVASSELIAGNKIKVTVTGGSTSVVYKVTVTATSNAATPLVYEDEVNVLVEEV